MRGAERVVLALGALGEAGQAAALTQRADTVAPAGEDLVRIGLVADVPDQLVVRRIEDVMQRHRQLDHAQAGAEMAAGLGDGVDHLVAQLVGELPELLGRQIFQVRRNMDPVEQRRRGGLGHAKLRERAKMPKKEARRDTGGIVRLTLPGGFRAIQRRVGRQPNGGSAAGGARGASNPHKSTVNRRRAARCRSACRRRRG